jgi:hypothetical protein
MIHAMARSLRYHPLFDSDVLNAAAWYDERQPQLGSDFVVRVERAVSQMMADPDRRITESVIGRLNDFPTWCSTI